MFAVMDGSSVAMVRYRDVCSLFLFILSIYFACILIGGSSRLRPELVPDGESVCDQKAVKTCAEGILVLDDFNVKGTLEKDFNCTFMEHTQQSAELCIHRRSSSNASTRFVLIGDSRVRQLYGQIVLFFHPGHNVEVTAGKHEDLSFKHPSLNLTIKFHWVAYVDLHMSMVLQRELRSALNGSPADLIVLASGVWTLRYRKPSLLAFDEYQRNLTSLVPLLNFLGERSSVIWMPQDPVAELLLAERRRMITNEWIDMYNSAAEHILCHSNATNIQVWRSARILSTAFHNMVDSPDGLHASPHLVHAQVNVLLDHYCNLP
ncbi:hypothetical protein RvY_03906 [Ramazzottius varieornatus]|uniref:SGNH domain-containing protein n=1 Tax=Ramazzottius varieornatus TaxID=947166 RepID=A0A1D1UZT5_RAMVA|nr:hypothetical protein RvY_03906 [Ramazzottius varieornatus]